MGCVQQRCENILQRVARHIDTAVRSVKNQSGQPCVGVLHAIATSRIRGLFTACNMEAELKTWRAFRLIRHVNTPYSAIRGRTLLKAAGIGLKRALLEYIFAAPLDAPLDQPCSLAISAETMIDRHTVFA